MINIFRRNFETRAQLCELIQEIRDVRSAAGNGRIIMFLPNLASQLRTPILKALTGDFEMSASMTIGF